MMPDIAAEPGSLAFAVRLTLAHQTPLLPGAKPSPCHRSGRPVLPNAICATLAGAADNAGKMPLADFCNRPTARALEIPLDSFAP